MEALVRVVSGAAAFDGVEVAVLGGVPQAWMGRPVVLPGRRLFLVPEDLTDHSGLVYRLAYQQRETRTCLKCHKEKMRRYRPEVLTNPNYWASEAIEED